MFSHPTPRSGFALVMATVMTVLIAGVLVSLTSNTLATLQTSQRGEEDKSLQMAGESAMNEGYALVATTPTLATSLSTVGASTSLGLSQAKRNGIPISARVTKLSDTDYLIAGTAERGTAYKGRHQRVATARITMTSTPSQSFVFKYSLFSDGALPISNSVTTDSYNSTNGDYGTGNKFSNGDVGTNSTATFSNSTTINGTLYAVGGGSLSNSVAINGNVAVGHGQSMSTSNSAHYTGSVATSATTVPMPPLTITTPTSNSNSSLSAKFNAGTGAYSMSNSTSDSMAAGTYVLNSLSMTNSTSLTINGDVTLYVNGAFNLSNSSKITLANGATLKVFMTGTGGLSFGNSTTLNNSGPPSRVQFWDAQSSAASFANSGSAQMVVYAPNATATFANSFSLYGAVSAKKISLSNSMTFHYDEALANSLSVPGTSSAPAVSFVGWMLR